MELKRMTFKVIALKQTLTQTKIYYLNLFEPKDQQLYMALYEKTTLSTLTIYNALTDQYEEVTSIFPESFLQNLSTQLISQINNKSYSDEPRGSQLKFIL